MPSNSATLSSPRSAQLTLLLLAAIFFLPFVIGSALFWLDWRPVKSGNHGELVQPPRPLPETGLQQADGRPMPTSELLGKWLLLLPAGESCNDMCQQNLQQMLQVHIALNKEQKRLRRVLIMSRVKEPALAEVQRRYPDLVVAIVNADAVVWKKALDGHGEELFVVDPFGNIMLRYADPANMRGVLKDLERLLKYSWVR